MKNSDTAFVATKWGENWGKGFGTKNEMGVVASGVSSATFLNRCFFSGEWQ